MCINVYTLMLNSVISDIVCLAQLLDTFVHTASIRQPLAFRIHVSQNNHELLIGKPYPGTCPVEQLFMGVRCLTVYTHGMQVVTLLSSVGRMA